MLLEKEFMNQLLKRKKKKNHPKLIKVKEL